jgi:hypothetical protein
MNMNVDAGSDLALKVAGIPRNKQIRVSYNKVGGEGSWRLEDGKYAARYTKNGELIREWNRSLLWAAMASNLEAMTVLLVVLCGFVDKPWWTLPIALVAIFVGHAAQKAVDNR